MNKQGKKIPLSKDDLTDALKQYPTKDDLTDALKQYPTKDDLKNVLKNYPTKDDLSKELKKELKKELSNYPTKDDLKNVLKNYPTKNDLGNRLLASQKVFRIEMQHEFSVMEEKIMDKMSKFTSLILTAIDPLLKELETRQQDREISTAQINNIEGQIDNHEKRISKLEHS